MEKVLDIAKGLLAGFVELLMHPVSKVTEDVQKEDIKKGAIKGAIISLVLSIVSVLATIRAIFISNSKSSVRDSYIEELNPILSILRTFGIYILVILAVAIVLFVISKLVKDQKSLPYTLSMTVNSSVVLTVGAVLALALSFWTPLSVLVITITLLHSVLTLIVSFVSSLANISTDKLVLVSATILTLVGVILAIISMIKYDEKLSAYADGKFSEKTQIGDVYYYKSKNALKKLKDAADSAEDLLGSYSDLSSLF